MSSIIKKRVNLEFVNTGLQFEDIAIGDENQTLGEFIESTLIRLEEQREIQLPDSDEGLTTQKDFKVISENGQLMDTKMLIADNSYMLECWKSRTNPTLILDSSIFEDTLNRPSVPSRKISLDGSSVPESIMESLVGRAKYDGPVCAMVKNDQPNSMVPEGYCDRLFQQDDDTRSMQSCAPSIAPSIASSIGSSIAPSEYDDNVNCIIPSATVTTTDGININLSQESNSSVLSSSSEESPKDQPPTKGEIKRKTSSFQRKHNVKGKYRMKPSSTVDNNLIDCKLIRRSISPHDVIKEGEVLDLGQENDIIPTEMPPPVSPVHKYMENKKYALRRLVNRKFSSSSRMYEAVQSFNVEFIVSPLNAIIEMECLGSQTIEQIKKNLWLFMREMEVITPLVESVWDIEKYCLTYKRNGTIYELYDEQQILQTSELANMWQYDADLNHQITVELVELATNKEKKLNLEIGSMLGMGLYQLDFSNSSELDTTRRKLVAVRQQAIRYRDPLLYSMEPEVTLVPLPATIQDKISNNQVVVHVNTIGKRKTAIQIEVDLTANDLLYRVFPDDEVKKEALKLSPESTPADFVLKVAGRRSYIIGHNRLIDFAHIRRCIHHGKPIELFLVKRLNPAEDFPDESIADRYLIDERTGINGSHKQLSALAKDHTQVFTLSLWDIRRQFRVRVVGLDNLKDVSNYDGVYIVMGMYHGGQLLCPMQTTPKTTARTYPRWNQWFIFEIIVRNIPKAARLCIGVYGYHLSEKKKQSKSKKESKEEESNAPLHWINMQILDHKGMLRQGLLKLNLWPVQNTEGTPDVSLTSPMGSTAINPDNNQCVSLYIELDCYTHPVACPTELGGIEKEWNPEQKVSSVFAKDLDNTILSDPLKPLTEQEKELCWTFRHHCATRPEALPKFLLCVNWADLEQVLEVHRLLKVWYPLTLPVAMELLDYHYADEKVRTMAVAAVERLINNDELDSFLLQLIQVLKFEPYHGSALASFLLKRALESKRIGHYFFWYLRAEMETPAFKHRFGILLESYLRGCGMRMFNEIKVQYTAINTIVKCAQEIKTYADKYPKGGQEYAQQELSGVTLPSSFSATFDPCIIMGKLDVTASKYMDSKKKPLWLEFQNTDGTALEQGMIKIIAKHGDDLRQDMLTIQMLSIMDKLWQENGLDLHLIPYGIIATGHEKGVIEVVQNAKTVAKIQAQYGGVLSSFKEDPIYKWLREKNPSDKDMEKAKETFMLSCAGYCVATYVLGIGDRHNDNIMVTTSGNLFHIDFGHFLGRKKQFMGVNRERAPFVLTPDFVYIMGGKNGELFKQFEEAATKAYLVIRQNANLFITLFSMMKSTGIPELRSVEDIDYLREVLLLNKSANEAAEDFKTQIQKAMTTTGLQNGHKPLVFKKSFRPTPKMYDAVQSFDVEFIVAPIKIVIEMECLGSQTVEQIKKNLWSFMREVDVITPMVEPMWNIEKYCLTYKKNGTIYELYDEQQILQTSELANMWQCSPEISHQITVEQMELPSVEENTLTREIGSILDMDLQQLDYFSSNELDATRRKLVAVRQQAVRNRKPLLYSMEPELSLTSLPTTIRDRISNNQVVVHVHITGVRKTAVQIEIDQTANDLLHKIFPDDEVKKETLHLSPESTPADHVLKVAGRRSYIIGDNRLIDFAHIRRCIHQGKPIELFLVKKLDPAEDFLDDSIADRYLIDERTGITGSHKQLSALAKDHTQVFTLSLWDIEKQFRVRVVGLDNLRGMSKHDGVYIVMGMYHGGQLLCPIQTTPKTTARTYPRWNQWFVFDITVKNIPKAARLCIGVYGYHLSGKKKQSKKESKEEEPSAPLHWINMQILDHKGMLRQGLRKLNLWPVEDTEGTPDVSLTSPMGSTAINPDNNQCVSLYIELDSYTHPVACPTELGGIEKELKCNGEYKMSSVFVHDFEKTILSDPLKELTKQEKELCWAFREHCINRPEALPKVLLCANWADRNQVLEVHRLLKVWHPLTLPVAMELLDYRYADEKVRTMAVAAVEELINNDELDSFLLQLVQVLKFEPYHGSALANFLLKRALGSKRIGHYFFWYLRAEMETPAFKHRFGILLESYLRGCGMRMFNEIKVQYTAINTIVKCAQEIKTYVDKNAKNGQEYAQQELSNVTLPSSFSTTFDPCIIMGKLDVTASTYMHSKKKPLWLEFKNIDRTELEKDQGMIKIIAKHGDDLRQDMLTIQMLTIMDKENGLDLHLIPYGIIATGHEKGVIEVVQHAKTVAKIQEQYGGRLMSSFKEDPIYKWLREKNPSERDMEKAKQTFMLSCAGYCVATYVLGIGDRHNDNIMVTTCGNLFHIDFGHFLGRKKYIMGVNRERAPFVLTPDFVYIMGGRNGELFRQFEEAATKAYLVIRRNANLFITLFSMMKSTGIPELRSVEDIDYLRKVLLLNKSENEAAEDFKSQIQACLRLSFSTQLNFYIHIWAHKSSSSS